MNNFNHTNLNPYFVVKMYARTFVNLTCFFLLGIDFSTLPCCLQSTSVFFFFSEKVEHFNCLFLIKSTLHFKAQLLSVFWRENVHILKEATYSNVSL